MATDDSTDRSTDNPSTDNSESGHVVYRVMDSRTDAQIAIQQVLTHAKHRIDIFDQHPLSLREREYGRPQTIELLRTLLLGNRSRLIRIALHEINEIESELPRLMTLMSQFSTQLFIQRTVGIARDVQDVLLLADEDAFWRKPVAAHPRSILSIGSAPDAQPYQERFEEIWSNTEPAVSSRATGL
jgi:hypothetical protein